MKNWSYRFRTMIGSWILPPVRLVSAERISYLNDDCITKDDDPVNIRAAVIQFPEPIKLKEFYRLCGDFPEHLVAGYVNPVFRVVKKDGVEVK